VTALILTYHAIEDAPGPLFVSPGLFEKHLETIHKRGASVLTVSGLADALRNGTLPERAVAITFDDGFASVARVAAPLLTQRGLTATIFCVAGYLGRTNDWPSQPKGAPRKPLATADELAALVRAGFEVGGHGFEHAPLVGDDAELLDREIVDSRDTLEEAVGARVTAFAYPYGAGPAPQAAALVRETYTAACAARAALLKERTDVFALPRVDAHYLRRPDLLSRAIRGEPGPYLSVRFLGARARRAFAKDYSLTISRDGSRPKDSGRLA
jgi:peptidoglycan/xylan/chitin deacetylase (PgdA/CDA1 family)